MSELVTDERKRLERQQVEEERLAKGESLEIPILDDENGETVRKSTDTSGRVPTGPMPEVERGLCVVCQDEEATLAVVDCGCVSRPQIARVELNLGCQAFGDVCS